MKFVALFAAFFISKTVQQGYVDGSGLNGLNLPSNMGSSSTTTTTTTVQVPTFPAVSATDLANAAALAGLADGAGGAGGVSSTTTTTIINAKNELSTPVRSIPSLFTRFPSSTEVANMADSGDVGALTKTLQIVAADDSVPCATKIAYLLDLLGAVKDAIRRKTLIADQLVSVIDGAKAEVARLNDQINRLQRERDGLRVPDLEARVNDLSLRLNNLYNQINAVRTQIGPEQARIAGYERQLQTLTRQNDDERNKITNDRIRLASTDNLIRDLEARIQEARDTRAALQGSITASENVIRENLAKINATRQSIDDLKAKVRGLQDTIDNLKRQTNVLEVDVDRARTDLSVARTKGDRLANDIRVLNDRLRALQPNANDDDLRRLRALVDNLNKVLPNINNDINREYYYCYGAGKVDALTVGSTIVYVVRGQAFGQYIQTAYGQGVGAPNIVSGADYRLQVVDPFSQVWTAKFGLPSARGAVSGAGWASTTCGYGVGSAASAPAGWGTVVGVNADGFVVKDAKGNNVSLNIGGCSRIQSTTPLPQAGQTIAWRGTPSGAGGYSLYAATCW